MKRLSGFTLMELLIVMTILAILAGVSLINYGNSVSKARLDVAVEQLILELQSTQLKAQNNLVLDASDDLVLGCWGVLFASLSVSPSIVSGSWNTETGECERSMAEEQSVLAWTDEIELLGVNWIYSNDTRDSIAVGEFFSIWFAPPAGEWFFYRDLSGAALNSDPLFDVVELSLGLSYAGETSEAFSKTLTILPSTSSYMIKSGYETF